MDTVLELDAGRSALATAAEFAGRAPSIHNSQPWRWRVVGPVLELHAARERQLDVTDPAGHLLMISCGAALNHALTKLAAEGWRVEVQRLPDRARPDLLATVTLVGRADASFPATQAVDVLRARRTDRRPVSPTVPDRSAVEAVGAAAAQAGASLHELRTDEVIELASAADRAQEIEQADPHWRDELAYWAGGVRDAGLGVPDSAIPAEPLASTVPSRDFGRHGHLPVSAGHDGAAVYGILFGQDSTAGGWLRAGEALSAAWVAALEHGLSLVPMSAAVEIAATRQSLRRILGFVAEPYLALRLGVVDPAEPGPGPTPRLPSAETVDIEP
jgi:nitroreductase